MSGLATADEAATHLLVVDDDARIRALLSRFLRTRGYRVTTASSAAEALHCIGGVVFDLVVLDVMMPGEDGLSLARRLRAEQFKAAIIMLTARSEIADRIEGLEAGVDDYLAKPFDPQELVLRIEAVLRRTARDAGAGPVRLGPLVFDATRGTLTDGEAHVRLTEREAEILAILAARAGETVPRADLVGDGLAPGDRSVDVQVTRLRKKIEADAANPRHLLTVRGIGYRLVTGT